MPPAAKLAGIYDSGGNRAGRELADAAPPGNRHRARNVTGLLLCRTITLVEMSFEFAQVLKPPHHVMPLGRRQ